MTYKFNSNKHLKYLEELPKISACVSNIETLYSPLEFRETLFKIIVKAKKIICIPVLYLENDHSGHEIVQALYTARKNRPELDISILVDWHRAQRNRIGVRYGLPNAHWYNEIAEKYPDVEIPIYGVPIHTREALGVLHLKGFIIDDMLLYSGASLSDVYLHQYDKYRYDRYHLIHNSKLAHIMYKWICKNIKESNVVYRFDQKKYFALENKRKIRQFRQKLCTFYYKFTSNLSNNKNLTLTPLVGLGSKNLLNKTIFHLILCAKYKLTFCTPYFNLPEILVRNIIHILNEGKKVEIIIGDKSTNDFYISPEKPFKIISILPYLYEIKLRHFLTRLQYYVFNEQLVVRIWKHDNNSYHLKGIWVDDEWMMITGNNLNPRAWRLDLENAILIHDPLKELYTQQIKELNLIRRHTTVIKHFQELESISNYPIKVRKIIRRLHRVRIDHLISHLI